MQIAIVRGDILAQRVEVIVNPWNRNLIPWRLLLPQGVSAAIKKHGGTAPFRELATMGSMPLGSARWTSAGRLPFRAIIHVAGINMFWRATEYSLRESVRNAMALAAEHGVQSLAFPLIGSGSGQRGRAWSKRIMLDAFDAIRSEISVQLVEYSKHPAQSSA